MKVPMFSGVNDLCWDTQLECGETDILLRLWIVQRARVLEPKLCGLEFKFIHEFVTLSR